MNIYLLKKIYPSVEIQTDKLKENNEKGYKLIEREKESHNEKDI